MRRLRSSTTSPTTPSGASPTSRMASSLGYSDLFLAPYANGGGCLQLCPICVNHLHARIPWHVFGTLWANELVVLTLMFAIWVAAVLITDLWKYILREKVGIYNKSDNLIKSEHSVKNGT
eukprot:1002428-Amphidinium_carterae.2